MNHADAVALLHSSFSHYGRLAPDDDEREKRKRREKAWTHYACCTHCLLDKCTRERIGIFIALLSGVVVVVLSHALFISHRELCRVVYFFVLYKHREEKNKMSSNASCDDV